MTVLRLARYDGLRALNTRRWLLVPVVFFVAGWVSLDEVTWDFTTQSERHVNIWDGPLSFLSSWQMLLFVCLIGFLVLVGDLALTQLEDGTSSVTAMRVPSRLSWWAAKLVAVGLLSALYTATLTTTVLLVSAIHLPWSLAPSPMATSPFDARTSLYPIIEGVPMPAMLIGAVAYLTMGLWVCGAITVTISLLWPRHAVPFIVGVVLAIAGSQLSNFGLDWDGIGVASPHAVLNYAVHFPLHFEGEVIRAPRAPWITATAAAAWLSVAFLTGAWRLRRLPL